MQGRLPLAGRGSYQRHCPDVFFAPGFPPSGNRDVRLPVAKAMCEGLVLAELRRLMHTKGALLEGPTDFIELPRLRRARLDGR